MNKKKRNSGTFTFRKIMFVAVIIGILLSMSTPNINKWVNKAKCEVEITRVNMKTIETVLSHYEMNVGIFPSSEQGLEALIKCPGDVPEKDWDSSYLREIPKDAWKEPYLYKCPGVHLPRYDLWSKGRDKKDGTQDDIHNWMEKVEEDL